MKKCTYKPFSVILLLIVSALLMGILAGCGGEDAVATTAATTKEIATTTAPAPVTTTATPVTTTAPVTTEPDQPSTEPEATEAPATTEKVPETTPPATEPAEPLPPLEITIPIPDPGEISADVEAEIKDAYAKQYDEDPMELSVELVANLGNGAYAIFVDGPWEYPCMEEEHIIHGYLFWYGSGRTMDIYKDGAIYDLSKAYEQGVIDANQVRDLYLIYADQMGYLSVRNPEKFYTGATIEDNFDADEIIIVTFPEYNFYPYTAENFAEIGCISVKDLSVKITEGKLCRILLLKLSVFSKQNVLDCIEILEQRVDLQSAEPSINIEIVD